MKSQKQAVVDEVLAILPGFQVGKDNALAHLSSQQLNVIKANIVYGIQMKTIAYSKDHTNSAETTSYGRSMVMNHLKKAKELNGGMVATSTARNTSQSRPQITTIPGISTELLPETLQEFVKTL